MDRNKKNDEESNRKIDFFERQLKKITEQKNDISNNYLIVLFHLTEKQKETIKKELEFKKQLLGDSKDYDKTDI